MSYLTEEQIEKAVDWWADRLRSPMFDAGADSSEMKLAEAMAYMMTKPATDENIEDFKNELRAALKDEDYNPYLGLHVDYNADRILQESAEASNITPNNFPWKTSMYFDEDGSVQVSLGYGAAQEELR